MSKKNEVKVRLAKSEKDLRDLLKVQRETWIKTYVNPKYGITEEMIKEHFQKHEDPEYLKDRLTNLNTDKQHNWIAVTETGDVIGWIGSGKKENKGSFGIYVLEDYQGKDVGKALLKKCLEWLKTQDYIEISVLKFNKNALEFYKRMGFNLTGEREEFKLGEFIGEDYLLKLRKDNRHDKR